jgi:hypothetical protein
MRPVLIVQFSTLPDNIRVAVPHMARILRAVADRIERGDAVGTIQTAEWHIETEVTLDEIREAIQRADPDRRSS